MKLPVGMISGLKTLGTLALTDGCWHFVHRLISRSFSHSNPFPRPVAQPAELHFYESLDTLGRMLAKVYSCAVIGLDGAIVEVEVDTSNGLPSFVDVGSKSQRRGPVYGKASEASWQNQMRLKASFAPSPPPPRPGSGAVLRHRMVSNC